MEFTCQMWKFASTASGFTKTHCHDRGHHWPFLTYLWHYMTVRASTQTWNKREHKPTYRFPVCHSSFNSETRSRCWWFITLNSTTSKLSFKVQQAVLVHSVLSLSITWLPVTHNTCQINCKSNTKFYRAFNAMTVPISWHLSASTLTLNHTYITSGFGITSS